MTVHTLYNDGWLSQQANLLHILGSIYITDSQEIDHGKNV
jgi:hypothetical protein